MYLAPSGSPIGSGGVIKHSPLTEIKQQNNQKITQKTRTRNPISSTLEVSSVFFLNFAAIVTALFTLNFEF